MTPEALLLNLHRWVDALCTPACAGRAAGSPGGKVAKGVVASALREAGLTVEEQPVPGCGGTNLLARVGAGPRWVLVGAHYDHLGQHGADTFHGADDNAAAVAVLVELGRALAARPPEGRGVMLAAFDGEEPPHFHTQAMGSAWFVAHPPLPLKSIDLMVNMDLVGHALGPPGVPAAVAQSLFALGAERSEGTSALVDGLREPGLQVRRADAEVIPPLSDHWAFWEQRVPFVFLTCGRWQHYHRPTDTPEKLDFPKMAATTRWLEQLVRAACARPAGPVRFTDAHDDASTLAALHALFCELAAVSADAASAKAAVEQLVKRLDARGTLPAAERAQAHALVQLLEGSLG